MKHINMGIALAIALLALGSCGSKPPTELFVGDWEATMDDETAIVHVRADGTVQANRDDVQRWSITEEDDCLLLTLYDIDDGDVEAELTLVFENDDRVVLSDDHGMRLTMDRLED